MNDDASPTHIDEWIARLRILVDTFEAMSCERERRAALYYVIARHYGNDVGDRVLWLVKDAK